MEINSLLNEFTDFILDYALLLAAIGTLSMALVEAVKGIFSAKAKFHKNSIKNFMMNLIDQNEKQSISNLDKKFLNQFLKEDNTDTTKYTDIKKIDFGSILSELEFLCSGVTGDFNNNTNYFKLYDNEAFYSLTTEQLMVKIQRAFEYVLQNPKVAKRIFTIIALKNPNAAKIWLSYLTPQKGNDTTIQQNNALQSHAVLINSINNQLDTLQINTLYAWGRRNRFASIILGAVILFLILFTHLEGISFKMFLFSILGGIASPVCKNLVLSIKGIVKR